MIPRARPALLGLPVTTVLLAALTVPAGPAGAATPAGTVAPHVRPVCSAAPAGHAACDSYVVTDSGMHPLAASAAISGYTPAQLQAAYGVRGRSPAGVTTVAVVDAYASPRAASDLAAYRTQFGLGPATLTQLNQTGGTTLPRGNTSWGQEEMLDLEMVSAMCPACHILYVGANSTSFADLGQAVDTAVAKGATVVSNSYGGGESANEVSAFGAHYNHPGVAITVSSGDSGYGVQAPAAFATVTAVGGTHLTLNADGTRKAETAWSGAGSGCSHYVGKPAWQHDTGCARRTVADVSADADPNTGVAVYDSYGSSGGQNWYVFGGTSVAAPIVGGLYGLAGPAAGVPAQRAYTAPAGSLFDVRSGSNGSCSPAYLCTARAGYDGPTGLGAPIGTGAF